MQQLKKTETKNTTLDEQLNHPSLSTVKTLLAVNYSTYKLDGSLPANPVNDRRVANIT